MDKRKKAAPATQSLTEQDKVSNSSRIKASVKALFLRGEKLRSADINRLANTNDSRKYISLLRAQGMHIVDLVLPGGRKLYWLADEDRQLPLFDKEGGDQ